MPEFLTLEDVLELHAGQIKSYGGSEGLRSSDLLQSAIAQPGVTFGGQFLHTDIFQMAAAYLFHLVQNHPFIDGNKRIGLEAALVFLELNGQSIEVDDDITIRRIQFHQERMPIGLLGRHQCAAGATEQIQHVVAGSRRVLHRSHGQLDRLARRMAIFRRFVLSLRLRFGV